MNSRLYSGRAFQPSTRPLRNSASVFSGSWPTSAVIWSVVVTCAPAQLECNATLQRPGQKQERCAGAPNLPNFRQPLKSDLRWCQAMAPGDTRAAERPPSRASVAGVHGAPRPPRALQRPHGLTLENSSSPMRRPPQLSSAQGASPATTMLARKRSMGSGSAMRLFRSCSDSCARGRGLHGLGFFCRAIRIDPLVQRFERPCTARHEVHSTFGVEVRTTTPCQGHSPKQLRGDTGRPAPGAAAARAAAPPR